jgi:hypothetical protein
MKAGWHLGWWSLLGQPPEWIRNNEEGTSGGYKRRGLSLTGTVLDIKVRTIRSKEGWTKQTIKRGVIEATNLRYGSTVIATS